MHTPEGMPLPPNTLAELQRDTARLGFVVSQIREIEEARQKRLEQQPETGPHAMVRHDEKYCGHFLLRRVDFGPQKLSIELDRPRDNLVSVTLAMAATEFAEASQVVKIISGEIEPP